MNVFCIRNTFTENFIKNFNVLSLLSLSLSLPPSVVFTVLGHPQLLFHGPDFCPFCSGFTQSSPDWLSINSLASVMHRR